VQEAGCGATNSLQRDKVLQSGSHFVIEYWDSKLFVRAIGRWRVAVLSDRESDDLFDLSIPRTDIDTM
jgi:hypothetical protein